MKVHDVKGEAIPEALREKTLREQAIFDGHVLRVRQRLIRQEDGLLSLREVVEHNGGVAILAVNRDDEVYMVRQYRSAARAALLEIPAGKLEIGEDPAACAVRELEEECALKVLKLHPLGSFYPTPGYSSEVIRLFWTERFLPGEQNLDEGEQLEVHRIPLLELAAMIKRGEILDGKTQVAVLRYLQLRAEADPAGTAHA